MAPWVARLVVFSSTTWVCVAVLLGDDPPYRAATDRSVLPEGAPRPSQSLTFTSRAGALTYYLGSELTIGGLYFQGDGPVDFTLLLSTDGTSRQRITLPRIRRASSGTRTR